MKDIKATLARFIDFITNSIQANTGKSPQRIYFKEIDGLRGLAVLIVLGFHLGISGFGGGYLGVDAFFVISGFLITGIIYSELKARSFSYPRFLMKRANRLLPALALATIMTTIGAWLVFSRAQLDRFGDSLLGVGTYTSNIIFMLDNSYFEQSTSSTPLLHTWSLGVEEQFYILFPLLAIFLWNAFSPRALNLGTILITASSFLAWIWLREVQPTSGLSDWAFYMLPTRAWELGAGGILAIQTAKGRFTNVTDLKKNQLAILGILTFVAAFIVGGAFPDRGFASLLMVISTLVLIATANASRSTKLLRSRTFITLGLLSYGIYLFHYPLIAFAQIQTESEKLSLLAIVLVIVLTLILSVISLILIENPVRLGKLNPTKTTIWSLTFVSTILALGLVSKVPAQDFPPELETAQTLIDNKWAYFPVMDERVFQKNRLTLHKFSNVEHLVVGSSRTMSINSTVLSQNIVNLSVSGASLEDIYTLALSGLNSTKANSIVIGLDPWTLNKDSGQERWISIKDEYETWKTNVLQGVPLFDVSSKSEIANAGRSSWISHLYNMLNNNFANKLPTDGTPEVLAKRHQDGSIVYSEDYLSLSPKDIELGFGDIVEYANMKKFNLDYGKVNELQSLLEYLKQNEVNITLLLSPYHPEFRAFAQEDYLVFSTAEHALLELAKQLKINVLGSFDPHEAKCVSNDFYDGMHPKESCLTKIFMYFDKT